MNLKKADAQSIKEAGDIIRRGGLVAFPTETVYGLGASALDPAACARIFEAKQRPFFDPLIVHIDDMKMLSLLAVDIPEIVYTLADKFWPGPLTFVLKKSELVPDIVSAGLPTVAVRMPSHPVARELITSAGIPIAAPSANPFGYLSPTEASHVASQLGDRVDMILDGGSATIGVESTIIKVDKDGVIMLRPGGLPMEELVPYTGEIIIPKTHKDIPEAPGELPSHYAPHAKVVLIKEGEQIFVEGGRAGILSFRKRRSDCRFEAEELLSEKGDMREAASNLFSALHRLDSANLDVIFAEAIPEEGLGLAIMNRLHKASKN